MTIIEKLLASDNARNYSIPQKFDALHIYALHWFRNYCWKEIERLQRDGESTTMLFESVVTINDLHNLMMLCSILIRKAQTPVTYEDVIAIKQIYAEFEKLHTFENVEDNDDD